MRLSVCLRSSVVLALGVVVAGAGLRAQSLRAYGAATPGTGGVKPFLWATSTPRSGNKSYGLSIDRGKPNALAVFFFSQKSAKTSLGGVNVLIDLAASLQLPFVRLDKAGRATLKLPLPDLTAFLGQRGYHQAYIADSGGAALGFSATQGLEAEIVRGGLVACFRSTGRANTPQPTVNLDTGKLSFFSSQELTNADVPDLYPGGTHFMVGSGLSNKVFLFDAKVFPPKFVTSFASQKTPWSVNFTPDGLRCYIVNQGPAKSNPEVQVVWAKPGSSVFGKPVPNSIIKMGKVIDGVKMDFTSNGHIGILSTFGLVGGPLELRKYDTNLGSTTYHKVLGTLQILGEFLGNIERVDDNTFAVTSFGFSKPVSLRLVDIRTMKVTSTWVKNYGVTSGGMAVDPRKRYVYVGKTPSTRLKILAGIVRTNIDTADANYGKQVSLAAGIKADWGVYDIALSDAGDRLYAVAGKGIQGSFVGSLLEYDTVTLKVLRTWDLKTYGNLYNIIVR